MGEWSDALKAKRAEEVRKVGERKARRKAAVGVDAPASLSERHMQNIDKGKESAKKLAGKKAIQLPRELAAAVKAAKIRVPEDAHPDAKQIAAWAFERIVQVAAGALSSRKAPTILKGASMIREEICGPIKQQVELSGGISLAHAVQKAAARIDDRRALPSVELEDG